MDRIQTPITADDVHTDLARPLHALAQFYAAMNHRDLALMARNWGDGDDVSMDNPLGGIRRGFADIAATYQALFTGPFTYGFKFFDYTLHEAADHFLVVGRERGWISRHGERLDLAIRTSRLFTRQAGIWRQFHHHGSIESPAMLGAYQALVFGQPIT